MLQADARHIPLADESVQCCVTSPPYWGLRDYGLPPSVWGGESGCAHAWGDEQTATAGRNDQDRDTQHTDGRNPATQGLVGCPKQVASQGSFCRLCGAWRGCLGLEPTPELYVEHMVEVFREVKRVLRSDGTVFLNLGDSYAGGSANSGGENTKRRAGGDPYRISGVSSKKGAGLKPKDLVGIPWRVAFALQADGWWLRSDVIWHKPNPMPESVRDRPTKAHEYVFLLTKAKRYYYDQDAVREPAQSADRPQPTVTDKTVYPNDTPWHDNRYARGASGYGVSPAGRNRRTVWTISTQPYKGAHFATFPPKLVEPCVLAGTSAKGACPECGAPWERVTEETSRPTWPGNPIKADSSRNDGGRAERIMTQTATLGWRPTCAHYDARYRADFPQARSARKRYQRMVSGDWWRRVRKRPGLASWPVVPCIVADPFAGSGTVGAVCAEHGREFVGVELNREYIGLAQERIGLAQGRAWEARRQMAMGL